MDQMRNLLSFSMMERGSNGYPFLVYGKILDNVFTLDFDRNLIVIALLEPEVLYNRFPALLLCIKNGPLAASFRVPRTLESRDCCSVFCFETLFASHNLRKCFAY
jgi:hypothetical protein